MKASLRVGVVGAGSLGYHHIRILREVHGIELVGFHEAVGERAARVESELGARAYPSLQALLQDVDAATVVVPTSAHHAVAQEILARGIHAFIEKPITTTLDEADDLLAIAARTGAILQIGHVERFNRAVRAALPYVSDPRFVESERLAPFNPRGSDVAVVLDLMIHDLDLLLTLMGDEADSISAVGIPVLTPMIDIANARITFGTGAVANVTASRISRERVRKIRIFQASGYLSLDLAHGTGEFFRLKAPVDHAPSARRNLDLAEMIDRISLTAPEGEPLRLELESFRDAVTGNGEVVVTGEAGRRALAVALRIVSEIERTLPSLAGELVSLRA